MNATQVLIGLTWLPALVIGLICLYCGIRFIWNASGECDCQYPDIDGVDPYSEEVE